MQHDDFEDYEDGEEPKTLIDLLDEILGSK
jgi:hypothetical protein